MAGGIFIRLNGQGTGSYFVDDPNLVKVPSWFTLNATIGIEQLRMGESSFTLSCFVAAQNLLNAKFIGSAWINPDLNAQGKPMYIEPGLPRNLVAAITIGAAL
jgi:outer membrane receptor protein involved in Fe transport